MSRGTITIRDGRILAVEPRGNRRADLEFPDAAILPGFVNAHTHLDLSGMRGRSPPSVDFTTWLRAVIEHRRQQTPDQVEADTRAGLAECLRHGTTLVGDIAAQGLSWPLLRDASVWSVVFFELLGLSSQRALAAWSQAQTWLENHPPTMNCRPGLSPHAPYSVRADLFAEVAELARRTSCPPIALHLAETQEEMALLRQRSGPFVDFLRDLGVWDPTGLVASPEAITDLFSKVPNTLFVHGNYLKPAATNGTVVYCPRTHAAFGHTAHPFRDFLRMGTKVALGTDSLASNPDLSVLAEARFLHNLHPDLPGETLLRMATLHGAAALGWQEMTGSLTPGKSADLVVLPLANEKATDPHTLLWNSSSQVRNVLWRGNMFVVS